MTKTIRNLIAAMLLIGASQGAMADFQTGNQLLAKCENEDSFAGQGECLGYLKAAIDTYRTLAVLEEFEPFICMPERVNGRQIEKIWIKYANENPENLHMPAAALVLLADIKAFPCD